MIPHDALDEHAPALRRLELSAYFRIVEWKDGRTPRPESICTAHRFNGEPCRKQRVTGATVCTTHGGRAPQVKEKARIRLEMAGDKLAKELLRIAIDDPDVPDALRLAAVRDALSRIRISEKTEVSVEVSSSKPFEELLADMFVGGSRAESRAARGVVDEPTFEWIDAELVDAGEDGERDDGDRDGVAPLPSRTAREQAAPAPMHEAVSTNGLLSLEDALNQLRDTSPPPAPYARRRMGR